MKNKTTFSYLAGYLDGDGCFYAGKFLQKQNNIVYEYSIQVLCVNKNVISYFTDTFGGAYRAKQKRPKQKIPYVWSIKNKHCKEVAYKVQRFLVEKKELCDYFIQFCNSISESNYQYPGKILIEKREKLIEKIREIRHMNDFVTKENIKSLEEITDFIVPSEEDLAYMAGFIDAEGCFRIKKWKPRNKPNHVYAIHLEIGNTKFPIFPWLLKRFGGNVNFHQPKNPKQKAVARWSLSAKSLYELIPKILPFLRTKKEVCTKLLEFQNTIIPNGGDRHSKEFHDLYTKVISQRELIVNEIHRLNSKGSI